MLVKTREGLALPTAWAANVSPRSSSWEGLSPVFYDEFYPGPAPATATPPSLVLTPSPAETCFFSTGPSVLWCRWCLCDLLDLIRVIYWVTGRLSRYQWLSHWKKWHPLLLVTITVNKLREGWDFEPLVRKIMFDTRKFWKISIHKKYLTCLFWLRGRGFLWGAVETGSFCIVQTDFRLLLSPPQCWDYSATTPGLNHFKFTAEFTRAHFGKFKLRSANVPCASIDQRKCHLCGGLLTVSFVNVSTSCSFWGVKYTGSRALVVGAFPWLVYAALLLSFWSSSPPETMNPFQSCCAVYRK